MVFCFVLSKAEAPKFMYFGPKYNFQCQNISYKIKYNFNIALHTLTNITFIHKPMSQSTVVKVTKYKTVINNYNKIVPYCILKILI